MTTGDDTDQDFDFALYFEATEPAYLLHVEGYNDAVSGDYQVALQLDW